MNRVIGKKTFPWFLWDIYKKGYTGGLRVEKGSLWKEIYFDKGLPVGSKSNLLKECLGWILVSQGKLSGQACEESLVLMKGLNKKQGEALVIMGLIREEDLPDYLRLQLKVRLLDLFCWVNVTYRFKEGDIQPAIPLNERIGRLIIDGVREGYGELEKVLLPQIKGKYLKKSKDYEGIAAELGLKTHPQAFDGELADSVLFTGREPSAVLYACLITGALDITDISKDAEKLTDLYEKIMGKSHFEVLGISQGAKDAEIKKAYYSLAKKYHPDKFEAVHDRRAIALSNEIFCRIASAYEVLSDERSRRDYEERLKRGDIEGDATLASRILLAEMEFKKGQNLLRFSNFEGAAKCFETAVSMNPDEAEFYAYFGWAIFNKAGKTREDSAKAKEYIKKALSMNPRIAMAYYFQGFILRVEGDTEAALKEFDRALRLKSDMPEALREIRLINARKATVKEKERGLLGFLRKGK